MPDSLQNSVSVISCALAQPYVYAKCYRIERLPFSNAGRHFNNQRSETDVPPLLYADAQWRVEGGLGVQTLPPPEIPNALQNRAKLNPIVKTVKNC